MGTKINISDLGGAYGSTTSINSMKDTLQDEFDNCLSLDGTSPNSMGADFDLNSNDILNGGTGNFTDIVVGGTSVIAQVTAAAASATAAAASETAAAASEAAAAASADFMDDLILGAKASDPTVDNDGDALQAGALYFNTGTNTMKAYTGSSWGDISVPTTHIALTDTPNSYSGEALKYLRVNAGETAIEFTASAATVGDGDYGDITVSSSGTVWTVDDGLAVSNANLTTPTFTTSFTFAGTAFTGVTGADLNVATGTAGTASNLAMWNADGDLVDSTYSVIDEDSFATDSDVKVPTQQSTKAYVDAQVATVSDTFGSALLHLQDSKTAGTDGGTFTSGAWRTRTLNTEVTDEIGSTLSANQFTLPDGTYWVEGLAESVDVQSNKLAIYNVTDATYELYGVHDYNNGSSSSHAQIYGRFTVAGGPDTFELRHYSTGSTSTIGFGRSSSIPTAPEIFADLRIWKVG